ncbi:uncharacterized protein LOC106155279 [Lingula anatina]|uniref:Uncharacterized protein LOC106155279 n=1 Tax=Lingula anatina TaxID=7574 RepID=A0A1S3HHB7_LINAN|nr:uncharacterized protein LOC106155279 [Lingula anatina]|eukprot:XP_013385475.1 uncharacterized protein LOC106155279 [Lingula anatina]
METDEEKLLAKEKNTVVKSTYKYKLGVIFACLGTVVGTGNIWRFPRILATNSDTKGGLVFLIVWLFFLFFWSIPMLLTEYSIGRYTRKATIQAFRHFHGDKATWAGAWVTLVSFFISCYYSVVVGWCFYYFGFAIGNPLPENNEEGKKIFDDFVVHSSWPILFHAAAILCAGVATYKGVKTIERACMVMVPTLLVIVIFTFIWSLTRKWSNIGLTYMFTPSWESFGDPRLWVDAVSQNAFDTGAGMGLIIPYAAYMTSNHGIVRYGTLIPATNNMVSLICGMTIISTAFSSLVALQPTITQEDVVNILKDSGPGSTGVTFIWVPVLFQAAGDEFGRVLCVLFFLCLSFAGLSSLISNVELLAQTMEDFGLKRKFGSPISLLLVFLIGLPSAFSLDFLSNQDFVWGFALLINGLMLQGLVIFYGANTYRQTVFNNFSLDDWYLPKLWHWIVKFIAPLEAVVLLVWWAIDLIVFEEEKDQRWYEFGAESFMLTIVQWLGFMLLVVIANILLIKFRPHWFQVSEVIRPSPSTPYVKYGANDDGVDIFSTSEKLYENEDMGKKTKMYADHSSETSFK